MKKKILIILLLTNLLLLGVGGTYAAYRDEAVGTINEFNFAKIIFNNEETSSISLPNNGLKPGEKISYNFKVSNNKDSQRSDVNIDYKITIQTYHLIPTTIKLYDTNDGNRELLLTCNESAQRDEEYKINCVSDDYTLYYSSNDEDNYEVEVIFDSTDAEGNPWPQDYSELLDFIDIKIDSWQKTN